MDVMIKMGSSLVPQRSQLITKAPGKVTKGTRKAPRRNFFTSGWLSGCLQAPELCVRKHTGTLLASLATQFRRKINELVGHGHQNWPQRALHLGTSKLFTITAWQARSYLGQALMPGGYLFCINCLASQKLQDMQI